MHYFMHVLMHVMPALSFIIEKYETLLSDPVSWKNTQEQSGKT